MKKNSQNLCISVDIELCNQSNTRSVPGGEAKFLSDKRMSALALQKRTSLVLRVHALIYAARSGRDIQLMIGIAGSTHPSPATT